MKLKRILLLREMRWIFRFFVSLMMFFWLWLRSRSFVRLTAAIPVIAVTGGLAWAVIISHQQSRDPAVFNSCLTLARTAAADGDLKNMRLLFRKAQQMAPGNMEVTMEMALALLQQNERAEAYQLLASIAPARKSGHLAAHRFLAENPPDLPPVQKDYFQALHLSHLVRNSAETRVERTRLLQILARYRRMEDVEKLIRDALDRYPEDRLFLAQLKAREGDPSGARHETEQACKQLSMIVANEPQNADRRVQLAQGYVFLTRFADAVCVVSEGMSTDFRFKPDSDLTADSESISSSASTEIEKSDTSSLQSADGRNIHPTIGSETPSGDDTQHDSKETEKLAAALSNVYTAWLRTLPSSEQEMQLQCLRSMLNLESSDSARPATLSDLATKMQSALMTPSAIWLRAAMEGNARAARGELQGAERSYRLALNAVPNDPTLANNLAWVLMTQARSGSIAADEESRQQLLAEALRWSELAVSEMPEVVSFLETRGQIQASLGNHAEALADLTACLERGKDSPQLQRTIEACVRALR